MAVVRPIRGPRFRDQKGPWPPAQYIPWELVAKAATTGEPLVIGEEPFPLEEKDNVDL